MDKNLFAAIATMTGTIIGAGFLGIPYVVEKAGFLVGLAYLLVIGIILIFVRLYFGEVVLRTKGNHGFAGYADIYLGKFGKSLIFLSIFFGIYSALVAYLLAEGESLSFLFFGNSSYTLLFGILFWLSLAFLSYEGLRALKKFESVSLILMILFILTISVIFAPKIRIDNLMSFNYSSIFLPFGIILFSLLGTAIIPELRRELLGKEKLLKKALLIGGLIPILVYIIFTWVVVGSFRNINEVATLTLGRPFVLLGILTMFTAYFGLTITIRDVYRFDFGWGRFKGWILAVFVPLILFIIIYFFKIATFTLILGAAGILAGGIEIIVILLMFEKAKKIGKRKPEYTMPSSLILILLIILIYIIGILSKLIFR